MQPGACGRAAGWEPRSRAGTLRKGERRARLTPVSKRLLHDVGDEVRLADRLSRLPEVAGLDDSDEKEAERLARAFADLEQSFQRFRDEQLPRLMIAQLSDSELGGLLLEIGEEFRHIGYHLREPKFYRYLGLGSND
jgi:hypothetical protein